MGIFGLGGAAYFYFKNRKLKEIELKNNEILKVEKSKNENLKKFVNLK